jgi:hypothetical protein
MANLLCVQNATDRFSTMREFLSNTITTLRVVSKQVEMLQQEYTALERQQRTAAQCEVQTKQPVLTIVVEDVDSTRDAEENMPGCTFGK